MNIVNKIINTLNHKLYNISLIILSFMIIGGIGAYCMSPAIDSDAVEGLFWADAAINSKSLLNSDFVYSYAIPFGPNLILIPFVKLFGISQFTNSIGMLFFYAAIVAINFLFLREVTHSNTKAIMGTAVMMLAFRTQVGVNLLHHILFYQIGFICLVGMMAAVFHIIRVTDNEEMVGKEWYAFLLMFSLWSGTNGMPTILLAAFPTIVAIAVIVLILKTNTRMFCLTGGIIILGAVVGYVIYTVLIHGIPESNYLEKAGSYTFISSNDWIDHLRELPRIWIEYFMIADPEGTNLFSPAGIEILLSIGVALAAGVIPFYYFVRFRKLDKIEIMIFSSAAAVWIVCLVQFVFIRKGVQERVLYNGVFANFTLLAVAVCRNWVTRCNVTIRISSLILGGLLSILSIVFSATANWNYQFLNTEPLEGKGLSYGVAVSYWDANINTVSSGNKVKIREVAMNNGTLYPRCYQVDYSWYEEPTECDNWFLLLTEEDYQKLLTAPNMVLIDSCEDTIGLKGSYTNQNDSGRNAYNEYVENQDYRAMIFPCEIWYKCVWGQSFKYNFASGKWCSGCEQINGTRHIHEGGISYGPYMPVQQGESCRIVIEGKNLLQSEIQVYSIQNAERIDLSPDYQTYKNDKVEFTVTPKKDINALEVCIRNPADDNHEDIIIEKETLDIDYDKRILKPYEF